MLQTILQQLVPPLIDAVVPLLLAFLSAVILRLTGFEIEAKHRAALQSALANAAKLLLMPGTSVDDAIDYVERSVPDALTRFKARDRPRIAELLAPHIAALSLSGPAASKEPAGA
ncbi:hypothetical protein SAMN05892877_10920 [Rhizobium subbaraonis]|uniref:Uncharacterized protein n=1 Tax=Rhizobium subbaraonis TaxID=908946 RepID=A0A285UJM2_9HYPH|nr:hypothetical protein [Rhizobium subbaraonis]SOC41598.1 hypothetical protein SAMN05892877_10920 [Rhizobium subbaraonis]